MTRRAQVETLTAYCEPPPLTERLNDTLNTHLSGGRPFGTTSANGYSQTRAEPKNAKIITHHTHACQYAFHHCTGIREERHWIYRWRDYLRLAILQVGALTSVHFNKDLAPLAYIGFMGAGVAMDLVGDGLGHNGHMGWTVAGTLVGSIGAATLGWVVGESMAMATQRVVRQSILLPLPF